MRDAMRDAVKNLDKNKYLQDVADVADRVNDVAEELAGIRKELLALNQNLKEMSASLLNVLEVLEDISLNA